MSFLRKILIRFLVGYGKAGAGKPSYHGFFEQKVPDCLQHKR